MNWRFCLLCLDLCSVCLYKERLRFGKNMPVVVAFVADDSSILEDSYLNRMAARLAPSSGDSKIIHCELFFPNTVARNIVGLTGASYGIHFSGRVFKNPFKQFSKSQWLFKEIQTNHAQDMKMREWLDAQIGKKFNYVGYASFLTPCTISGRLPGLAKRYYCSQLTMEALNQGEVFGYHDGRPVQMPVNVPPHRVFEAIQDISTAVARPTEPTEKKNKLKFTF